MFRIARRVEDTLHWKEACSEAGKTLLLCYHLIIEQTSMMKAHTDINYHVKKFTGVFGVRT